jgi:hypothetical protein
MEGERPCCSPGSREQNVAEVLDFIRVAEEWVNAVQQLQAAQTQDKLPKEADPVAR